MSSVIDELITKYTLQAPGYAAVGARVTSVTRGHIDAFSNAKASLAAYDKGFQSLTGIAGTAIGVFSKVAAALAALGVAAIAAGTYAAHQAAEYEALVKSIEAIEGSADIAAQRLRELREIARAPGLGFIESIEGFTKLRRAGLGGDQSEEILRQFGNANALGGGGKEQLGRIMLAIQQMANKQNFGQEMMQLAEAGLPVYGMLKELFGTADTEELLKQGITGRDVIAAFTASMAKLPRVAGAAKNTFENVGDALNYMAIQAGSAINAELVPRLNELATSMDEMSDSGAVRAAFGTMMDNLVSIVDSGSMSMEGFLMSALETGVTVSAAFRNLALNLMDMYNLWRKFTPLGRLFDAVDAASGITPADEGRKAREIMEQLLQLNRSKAEKEKAQRDAMGIAPEAPADAVAPSSAKSRTTDYLQEIARNTRDTADQLKEYIFGGGELGRLGLGAVEIGGGNRSQLHQQRQGFRQSR